MAAEFLPLAEADQHPVAVVGNKAHTLARLLRAGLPVPDGAVLPADVRIDTSALIELVRALPPPLIVRSSADVEDTGAANAPGLFRTVRDVTPEQLVAAITQVRDSADAAEVRAYLGDAIAVRMGVIVQSQRAGVRGTTYSRRGAAHVFVDALDVGGTHHIATLDRRTGAVVGEPPPGVNIAALLQLVERCERALAEGNLDIEWVVERGQLWVVQARPLRAAERQVPAPLSLFGFTAGDDATWRWDAEHNPAPLSVAQAGLVEQVDRAGCAPYRMRVVAGYLYYRDANGEPVQPWSSTSEFQRARDQLIAQMNAALPPAVASVAEAVQAYTAFYQLYASAWSPRLRATRLELRRFLRTRVGEQRALALFLRLVADAGAFAELSRAELIEQVAGGAPEWDVASASYGENRAALEARVDGYLERRVARSDAAADELATITDQAALRQAHTAVSDRQAPALERWIILARMASREAERDDLVYARAQQLVRAQLLAAADMFGLEHRDDVFWLPLADVCAWQQHGAPPPEQLEEVARRNRQQHERAAQWRMPLAVRAGQVVSVDEPQQGVWHGYGVGGRAIGRVIHAGSDIEPRGQVLVAPAITPQMVIWARDAACIVSDYGGPLGHAIAMAGELGVPCVVGCSGASTSLRDGERVVVDGATGLVMRLAH